MAWAPNGHLLVINAQNGQVVEIDPVSGEQIKARWIDPDKAQKPPGSGDLFGIAMTPDGDGFYFVEDENNTLVLAQVSCPFSGEGGTGRSRRGFLVGAAGRWRRRRGDARARRDAGRRQATPRARAVLWPASGRHRHAAADAHLLRGVRSASPRSRDDVIAMLRRWTDAAARMSAGETARRARRRTCRVAAPDGGSALGLPPARLTITFGFGAGLFVKDGADRYGLAAGGRRRWSTCRSSTAISSTPRTPAATFRCRPAPTIRRSRFTPCASWRDWPMAPPQMRWAQAGFLPERRPARRRAT